MKVHELDPEAQSESDILCMEYRRVRVGVEECGSADKNLGTRKRNPKNTSQKQIQAVRQMQKKLWGSASYETATRLNW